jgi:hypothetical protein
VNTKQSTAMAQLSTEQGTTKNNENENGKCLASSK